MAGCDNLYGNRKEWNELHDFLKKTKPEYIKFYMKEEPGENIDETRICYIADIQGWLLKNCPFPWVQERLKECCFVQKAILGEAHHEREENDN
jgi:hypothetical protein